MGGGTTTHSSIPVEVSDLQLHGEVQVTSYYYFNAQRVAMRRDGVLQYIAGDHLGTTSLVMDDQGNRIAESRHYPYGEERWSWVDGGGDFPTDYRFTGERLDSYTQLYAMGARFYDAALGRWTSADTLVPDPTNPQSFNRYSWVLGNSLRFIDPSGHWPSPRKITYWWHKTRLDVVSTIGLAHGRQDVRNHSAAITALAVDFESVDPIMTAASIAHQASDIGERPFGSDIFDEAQARLKKLLGKDSSKGIAQLRQEEIEQLVGPGANPYDPTDAVKGMYAKLAQANAEISACDPSIGMTDRYMLLAIRQNSSAGSPIGYFFGEGDRAWGKMMAYPGYGGSWTFQLRQVLLQLEWLVAQEWWDLPEGVDLERWREIVFGEQGE